MHSGDRERLAREAERVRTWFSRNADRRNPEAAINTNSSYFADECASAIINGTLAFADRLAKPSNAEVAALVERGRGALRYVLNFADSNTRVKTVLGTFTLEGDERHFTKGRLEALWSALGSADLITRLASSGAGESKALIEARKRLALTEGCLDCNADDERRWRDTTQFLEEFN